MIKKYWRKKKRREIEREEEEDSETGPVLIQTHTTHSLVCGLCCVWRQKKACFNTCFFSPIGSNTSLLIFLHFLPQFPSSSSSSSSERENKEFSLTSQWKGKWKWSQRWNGLVCSALCSRLSLSSFISSLLDSLKWVLQTMSPLSQSSLGDPSLRNQFPPQM